MNRWKITDNGIGDGFRRIAPQAIWNRRRTSIADLDYGVAEDGSLTLVQHPVF